MIYIYQLEWLILFTCWEKNKMSGYLARNSADKTLSRQALAKYD